MRLTAFFLVLALHARTIPGDRYLAAGRNLETRQQWDAALEQYRRAMAEDAAEITYRMAFTRAVFQAAESHMSLGLAARKQSDLETALREFQAAHELSPGLASAAQELAVTREMILSNSALTPLQRVKKDQQSQLDRMQPVPQLVSAGPELVTLTLANQSPKALFEIVARYAGINVIFDSEFQPGKNVTLQLDGVTLDQALDHAALLATSFWKPLSATTIFVTNDNPAKRRDYEEQVTRIF